MAMTKKEKAELEAAKSAEIAAKNKLAEAKAMRWPEYEKPLPYTREELQILCPYSGPENAMDVWYSLSMASYQKVRAGQATGNSHTIGGKLTQHGGSLGIGTPYKTEEDAYRALRIELTEKYAKELAEIDAKIVELSRA